MIRACLEFELSVHEEHLRLRVQVESREHAGGRWRDAWI